MSPAVRIGSGIAVASRGLALDGAIRVATVTGGGSGSAYADAVLATTGLVSYWRLEETSGTTAADSKGANTGTYVNTPTLGVAGARAGSLGTTFASAQSEYVTVKDGGTIIGALTNATVEAWVKWTSGNSSIYCERGATGNAIWKFEVVNTTGRLGWTHRDDAGTLNQFNAGVGNDLTTGVWTHVAVVKSANSISFWKNGVQVGSTGTQTGNNTLTLTNIQSRIAGDAADGANYLNGSADEVAVYNVAVPGATLLTHAGIA